MSFNYGNYQNLTHNMQNQMELSHKTSNSLMPQSPLNSSQNTFASLPDLSSFNYNPSEIDTQDNSLIVQFFLLIFKQKPQLNFDSFSHPVQVKLNTI